VRDASTLGFGRVQLTGGDPLLCEFLPDLAAQITDAGMRCEVFTNGLALDSWLLEQLAQAGASFAFSFYSSDERIHDAVTRTPGSQQRTVAALERVVDSGLEVRAAIVAMEENADTLAETTDFLRGLGVPLVSSAASHAVGRGKFYAGDLPRCDSADPGENSVSAGSGPGADAVRSQGKLCVTYTGEVVPCIFNRVDVVGRIEKRRLRDIARAPDAPADRGLGFEELIARCRESYLCRSCQLTACALQACGEQ
jgi:MoaA/NifB/PqqE/SkfB family radical SAM enzyme